ncbi:MAG: hypothetical protein ACLUPK_08565 [Veillonella sp.]
MDSLAPIIDPYLVSQFESFGDMSLTIARISVLIFGTLLGVIIGYLISSFILKQGLVIAKRLERILTHIPNQELIAGTIGLLFGLIIANLIGVAFHRVPIIGPYIPIYIECYLLDIVALKSWLVKASKCTIVMYNNGVEIGTKKTSRFKMFSTHKLDKTTSTPKLLDTSVIIDGRIKELS